jgi:glycosyltransferase involved in cell wall biosynthesis
VPARRRILHKRKLGSALSRYERWGRHAGKEDAALHSIAHEPYRKKALNDLWVRRLAHPDTPRWSWPQYAAAAQGYVQGYMAASGSSAHDWLLLPTSRPTAAIISVMNEERTIAATLGQLNRLPLDEIIVVVNGSSDGTLDKIRQTSQAVIVHYPEPLGYDVGRAVGAKLSTADILLFVDGDFPIAAERLVPFIGSVANGADVALNDISPFLPIFAKWDNVTIMKRFLNVSLSRPELGASSLTAVPHALSRQAMERIGIDSLAVPPKAHAAAIAEGLRIELPASINVIAPNKRRGNNKGSSSPVSKLIVGDHVEALHSAMGRYGKRLAFRDHRRKRQHAGGRL